MAIEEWTFDDVDGGYSANVKCNIDNNPKEINLSGATVNASAGTGYTQVTMYGRINVGAYTVNVVGPTYFGKIVNELVTIDYNIPVTTGGSVYFYLVRNGNLKEHYLGWSLSQLTGGFGTNTTDDIAFNLLFQVDNVGVNFTINDFYQYCTYRVDGSNVLEKVYKIAYDSNYRHFPIEELAPTSYIYEKFQPFIGESPAFFSSTGRPVKNFLAWQGATYLYTNQNITLNTFGNDLSMFSAITLVFRDYDPTTNTANNRNISYHPVFNMEDLAFGGHQLDGFPQSNDVSTGSDSTYGNTFPVRYSAGALKIYQIDWANDKILGDSGLATDPELNKFVVLNEVWVHRY